MTAERRDIEILAGARETLARCQKGASLFAKLLQDADTDISKYVGMIQTDFSLWIRQNPSLDSRQCGLSIHDVDWIVHQFKVAEDKNGPRRLANLMLIEEKRFGKEPSFAQADTLLILDQCLQRGNGRAEVVNARGEPVLTRYYGLHTLQFSGSGPMDSERILWDRKPIDLPTLEGLIRFDIHPQSLLPRDLTERRHHANKAAVAPLFDQLPEDA